MSDMQATLLGNTGSATIRAAVKRCLEEASSGPTTSPSSLPTVIAGIGTTALHALKGRLLLDALSDYGVELAGTLPFDDPEALLANSEWTIALVLSPWKQSVASQMVMSTPSAERTGVVDTIVRDSRGEVGVNSNSWASQAAMETLMGGRKPSSILILGSGGSSNSVALACRRAWPEARLMGSARNLDAASAWAQRFDAEFASPADVTELVGPDLPSLVVNTTTWGETDDSEKSPFAFDFQSLVSEGNQFFDLNNRVSTLQTTALQAGMNVMSGTFMQRVTNACRAALSKDGTR